MHRLACVAAIISSACFGSDPGVDEGTHIYYDVGDDIEMATVEIATMLCDQLMACPRVVVSCIESASGEQTCDATLPAPGDLDSCIAGASGGVKANLECANDMRETVVTDVNDCIDGQVMRECDGPPSEADLDAIARMVERGEQRGDLRIEIPACTAIAEVCPVPMMLPAS